MRHWAEDAARHLDGLRRSRAGPSEHVSYLEFLGRLGVEPSEGQLEFCDVAFDGAEPNGSQLFGGAQTFAASVRRVLAAVVGARAGKSYLLVALRLLWGALVRDLSSLRPGQQASALIVSPDMRLAREPMRYIAGALHSDPDLEALIVKESGDCITIKRDDSRLVAFECLPASAGGRATRGRWYTDAALDECCFFRDKDYRINDEEVFDSVIARTLPGGQVMLTSTPWTEAGVLHSLWKKNFGHPVDAMAAHAATLDLWDTPELRQHIDNERARDADKAQREFDAQWVKTGGDVFFEAAVLEWAVDPLLEVPRKPEAGEKVAAGADFGFRRDCSAMVVAHEAPNGVIRIADIIELQPENGQPLSPKATVDKFASVVRIHKGTSVMADQHYRETVAEELDRADLNYVAAPSQPADAYVKARLLMRAGRVRIPDHPRLLKQLREVRVRAVPGGGMRVVLPRTAASGHGDLASAFVLALHQVGELVTTVPTEEAKPDPRILEKRRDAIAKAEGGPWHRTRRAKDAWWKKKAR